MKHLHVSNLQDPNGGVGDPSSGGGFPAGFVVLFVIVAIAGIGTTIWRVSFTRQMAQKAGLSSGEATAVAVLGGTLGTDAAVIGATLKPRLDASIAPHPVSSPANGTADGRLAELKGLLDRGLVTQTEYDERRKAILDSI